MLLAGLTLLPALLALTTRVMFPRSVTSAAPASPGARWAWAAARAVRRAGLVLGRRRWLRLPEVPVL